MHKLRTVSAGIITLILIATGISPMFAQSDAARLQGIITDQSSALVPGAKVQVTDLSTNRILETTSAPDSGAWSFPVLPPGNYVLQVSMDGFKPIKQNVTLQVAQVANINFVLEPGAVSEQLVVTADAALVDSASRRVARCRCRTPAGDAKALFLTANFLLYRCIGDHPCQHIAGAGNHQRAVG